MNPQFKIFAPMLKASLGPDNRMRLHGIASSTVKDRHGDTMSPSALVDMERSANNNMTIFLNHEYRVPEDVAGSVERAVIRSHPQDASIHDLALDIIVNQANERAVKAWEAINGGTQLGLSIGAMIPDGGAVRDRKSGAYEINHVELLETSLVGVPANPRSWVEYAVKSLNGGVIDQSVAILEEDGSVTQHTSVTMDMVVPLVEKQFDEEDPDLTAEEVEDQIEADAEIPTEEVVEEQPEVIAHFESMTFGGDSYTIVTNESTNPTITDATVNIKTPYADVSIDTGNRGSSKPSAGEPSQEALSSAPENEETDEDESLPLNPWAAIGLSGEPEVEEVEPALQILEPTVVASLRTSSDLLKAITRELIDTKKALDDAILERDAAIEATEKVLTNTADILARLSATPVGRRATVRQANEQFASLKSVYGDDFLTLLKKG